MADGDPSWDPEDVDWDPQGMTARPRRGRPAAAAAAGAACSHGGAAPRAAPPPAGGRERRCQANGCARDMASLGHYNQRNRICDVHIKADFARDGARFRFCQREFSCVLGRPVEAENIPETNQPTNHSLITDHYRSEYLRDNAEDVSSVACASTPSADRKTTANQPLPTRNSRLTTRRSSEHCRPSFSPRSTSSPRAR